MTIDQLCPAAMKLKDFYDNTSHLYDQAMRIVVDAFTWGAELDNRKPVKTLWIDQVTFRRKTYRSLFEKCVRKGLIASPDQDISPKKIVNEIYDVAGVRVICVYGDLASNIAQVLKKNPLIKFVYEKNYNWDSEKKPNGYRGYHIQAYVRVALQDGQQVLVPIEIQIRTCLQHVWAVAEHAILYKPAGRLEEANESTLSTFFKWLSKKIVVLDSALILAREFAKVTRAFNPESLMKRLEQKFRDLQKVPRSVKREVLGIFKKLN